MQLIETLPFSSHYFFLSLLTRKKWQKKNCDDEGRSQVSMHGQISTCRVVGATKCTTVHLGSGEVVNSTPVCYLHGDHCALRAVLIANRIACLCHCTLHALISGSLTICPVMVIDFSEPLIGRHYRAQFHQCKEKQAITTAVQFGSAVLNIATTAVEGACDNDG